MIALFNNTGMAWKVKNNSQKNTYSEISISTKTKNGDSKSLKISVPSSVNMDAIATTNSSDVQNVYLENTNIFYDNKTNNPNIGTVGENKDIFFISLDIQGCSIVDMTRQDLFVIGFLITRGCLFMIVSVKTGCNSFHITKYNRETKIETTYTFNINTDAKELTLAERTSVTATTVQNTTNKTYEPFKIRSFRPSRSTHLVFINNKDKALSDKYLSEGKLFSSEKNEIVYFDDDSFSDSMKGYLNNGYTAATLFTSLSEVIDNQFKDYDDSVTLMRSVFTVNNIILGGANTPIVIKR